MHNMCTLYYEDMEDVAIVMMYVCIAVYDLIILTHTSLSTHSRTVGIGMENCIICSVHGPCVFKSTETSFTTIPNHTIVITVLVLIECKLKIITILNFA